MHEEGKKLLDGLKARQERSAALIRAIEAWLQSEEDPQPSPPPSLPTPGIQAQEQVQDQDDFSDLSMWKASEIVLARSGREMNLAELARKLSEAGLYVDPAHYHSVLTAAFQRKPEVFEKVGRATWKLRDHK